MEYHGIVGSAGIVIGKVYHYERYTFDMAGVNAGTPEEELIDYERAIAAAKTELEALNAHFHALGDKEKVAIFAAHLEILIDETMDEETRDAIQSGVSAAESIQTVYDNYISVFEGLEDPLIRERASDMRDVSSRLLRCLAGVPEQNLSVLPGPVIVVADDLVPSDTASLDRKNVLGIITALGGVTVYNTAGEDVTAAADPALVEQIAALSAANAEDFSAKDAKNFGRLLPEGTELTAIEIPGYAGCVTGAYTAETAEGTRYAFAARPYGYANEPMEFYFVLDENGAIAALRTGELILHSDYFSAYELDEASYKESFIGLTGESYTGEQTLITGATMSSDAAASAVNDVFAAFDRLVESEG